MFVPRLFPCVEEDKLRLRSLAVQLRSLLALLWPLFVASHGWAATPAPVTIVDVMVLYWSPLANRLIIGQSYWFTDRDAAGFARRFYRAGPLR